MIKKSESTYISNLVMLGKPIVVEDGKHESLVKSLGIRQVFELKSLVEKRVERLAVNFGLKLFLPLGLRDQVDLDVGVRQAAHVHGWKLNGLDNLNQDKMIGIYSISAFSSVSQIENTVKASMLDLKNSFFSLCQIGVNGSVIEKRVRYSKREHK